MTFLANVLSCHHYRLPSGRGPASPSSSDVVITAKGDLPAPPQATVEAHAVVAGFFTAERKREQRHREDVELHEREFEPQSPSRFHSVCLKQTTSISPM